MASMLCPQCGNNVEFPPDMAGQQTNCPHAACQQAIILQAVVPEAIPAQPLEAPLADPALPGAPAAPMMPEAPVAPMGIPVPEAPLEEAPLGGPALPPLPGGDEVGESPIIMPPMPMLAEESGSRQEAMEELVEKYDTDDDGQLSIEELSKVKPEDHEKVDEVLVDYPALKAQLDALLERKQSRVAAETQAESKWREAEEAMASLEMRRKEEIQTTEQALAKARAELQRLNMEISDLEKSELTRQEKDDAEGKARAEAKLKETLPCGL